MFAAIPPTATGLERNLPAGDARTINGNVSARQTRILVSTVKNPRKMTTPCAIVWPFAVARFNER